MLPGVDSALDDLYLMALAASLWGAGLALGLTRGRAELVAPLRRPGLVTRVTVADVVLVPLLVWGLVRIARIPDDYAIGLLLVGASAAGPLGIKAAALARADEAAALCLVVVLELVNLVAIPVWATLLLPAGTELDPVPLLGALLGLVLAPLAVGLALRRPLAARATGLARRAGTASTAMLAVAVIAYLARDGDVVVAALDERVPLIAGLAVLGALGLGWLAGGPTRETRAAAALVTGVRANAVALAIASTSFPDRPDVRAGVVVFALFSITLPLVAAALAGRRAERVAPASAPA